MQFKHLSIVQLNELVAQDAINVVDTRDVQSFNAGHIPQAFNLNQGNLEAHLADCDMDIPMVVCCYHGISSQGVAQFLVERGFEDVFSLEGGFEAYQQSNSEIEKV